MKYISIFLIFMTLLVAAPEKREKIDLALKDLTIEEFLKVASKIYGKNILVTQKVSGNIDFISTAPIYKDEIADILLTVLESKGFTLVEDGSFYKVVRSSVAAKENLPIVNSLGERKFMVTKAISLNNENIDVVVQKIRHLLSASAKLVTMKESNTMLISEYPDNINTVIKAIESLIDNEEKDVEFITIKHGKASNVFSQVNAIIKARDKQNIVNKKFTILKDDSANSIIVVGKREQIQSVKNIITRLDQKEDFDKPQIELIRLTHTDAKALAKTISDLMTKTGNSAKKTNVAVDTKATITADEEMNSLIVVALLEDIKKIKDLVETLDVPRQQVYVKATIVELNKNNAEKIGFDYGVSMAGGDVGAGVYGLGMALASKGNAAATALLLAANSDDSDGDTPFALDIGLQFLSSKGVAETISEPSILCVNNKQSDIYVGRTISIQTAANSQTTGGTVSTYKRQDVGLTLTVKPRISSENLVALEVNAQLENLAGEGAGGQPTTTKSRVKTNAIVKNGEPVILGGLVREDESTGEEAVPFFSKIPFVGRLFRNNAENYTKQNLLIIVTPYIINGDDDLKKLRQELLEKEQLKAKFLETINEEERNNARLSEDS